MFPTELSHYVSCENVCARVHVTVNLLCMAQWQCLSSSLLGQKTQQLQLKEGEVYFGSLCRGFST